MVKALNWSEHQESAQGADGGEGEGFGRRHLSGGDGAAGGARRAGIVVAVDVVVVGAARRAHQQRADGEQGQQPGAGIGLVQSDLGEADRPPAGQQQQPEADGAVETRQTQIRAHGFGRVAVRPVAGRGICNAIGALVARKAGHRGCRPRCRFPDDPSGRSAADQIHCSYARCIAALLAHSRAHRPAPRGGAGGRN